MITNFKNLYVVFSLFLNFYVLFKIYYPERNLEELIWRYNMFFIKTHASISEINLNNDKNLYQEVVNFRNNINVDLNKINSITKILERQPNISDAPNAMNCSQSIENYNYIIYSLLAFTLLGFLCYFFYNYGGSTNNNICRCPTNIKDNSSDSALLTQYQNSADRKIHSFETFKEAYAAEKLALINRMRNENLTSLPHDLDLMILPSQKLSAAKNIEPILNFVSDVSKI